MGAIRYGAWLSPENSTYAMVGTAELRFLSGTNERFHRITVPVGQTHRFGGEPICIARGLEESFPIQFRRLRNRFLIDFELEPWLA